MILSKRSNGFYYVYFFQQNGKRTCLSAKTKIKAQALQFLSNFEKEAEERKKAKLASIPLTDFIQEYIAYSKGVHTPKTTKGIRLVFAYLEKKVGNVLLSSLTKSIFSDHFQKKIAESSIYQARTHRIYLASALNYAVDKNYITSNPIKEIKPFKIPEKQPLFFSEAEFQILLNATSDKDLKDLFIVAVNTGLRQMELLTLTWDMISFKERLILLNNQQHLSKSKKAASVPLNLKALQVLNERAINKRNEFVFTYQGRQINPSYITHKFKEIVRAAGLNDSFSFHKLRHTFASWLVQRNVPIQQVQQLLRHADLKTSLIYAHLRNDNLATSVNLLNLD